MYTVNMSVLNLNDSSEQEFAGAATNFIDKLSTVHSLQLEIPTKKQDGTRGDLPLWSEIVITAISTGAFMAIYTMAMDMFTIYANAEVELKFEDGSSISLKHLTREEAKAILDEHLENQKAEQAKNGEEAA